MLATHVAALSVVVAIPWDWYWRIGLGAVVLASLINAIGTQVLFLLPWAGREAIGGRTEPGPWL